MHLCFRAALLSSLLLFYPLYGTASEKSSTELVTHNEVYIEASPRQIWPYILDTGSWKTSARQTHLSGDRHLPGEVMRIEGGEGETAYSFHTEVIALEQAKRKVIRIYGLGRNPSAFASWTLYPQGPGALVSYDVYAEYPFPEKGPAELSRIGQEMISLNTRRYQAELELLRRIVEEAVSVTNSDKQLQEGG